MGLFKPAWMSKNKKRALASVDKLTNQQELCQAAIKSPHGEVKLRAVDKLTAQQELFQVATSNNSYSRAALRAAEKITDVDLIKNLAQHSSSIDIRIDSALKLDDQEFLAELASNWDYQYQVKVMNKLTDKKAIFLFLENIGNYRYSNYSGSDWLDGLIKKAAFNDQNLYNLAENAKCYAICEKAAYSITDVKWLSARALNSDNTRVRSISIKRSNDLTTLISFALDYEHEYNVEEAINKMMNRELALSGIELDRMTPLTEIEKHTVSILTLMQKNDENWAIRCNSKTIWALIDHASRNRNYASERSAVDFLIAIYKENKALRQEIMQHNKKVFREHFDNENTECQFHADHRAIELVLPPYPFED